MMNKMMVMMIAAALVIFLTAGCGSSKAENDTASDAAASQAADISSEETPLEVDEELANVINEAGDIGEGTAGSSLKKAKLVHDLAALAAEKGYTEKDVDRLRATFENAIDNMDDERKESVKSIFENSVFPMLDSLIDEGGNDMIRGLLNDAGVESDLDAILETPGLKESYQNIKSAYPFH